MSDLPDNRSPGQRVLDEIVKQGMVDVAGKTDDPWTFVWAANVVEQLDAVIAECMPPAPPVVGISRIWGQGDRIETIESRFSKGTWRVQDLVLAVKDEPEFDLPLYHIDLGSYDFDGADGGLIGFAQHMRHVLEADLSHPVIMDEWGRIIDGRHRIVKALIEGLPTVRCKRLPPGTVPTHT